MANTLALIRFPEFDRWAARKIDALDGWTISQAARERFFGQGVRWNSTCFVSSCDFLRGISKYLSSVMLEIVQSGFNRDLLQVWNGFRLISGAL